MEESKSSKRNKPQKRKRVKLECLVCHRQFDDDYRTTHNKTFHHAMLKQNKAIPYQNTNAQLNPFVAAKKACHKYTSQTSSCTPAGSSTAPNDDHDETLSEMPPFEEIVVMSEAASSDADPVPCLTQLRSEIEPQLLPTPVDVSSIPENESMLSVLTRQDNESSNIDLSFETSSESENDESSSTKTLNDNWLACAGELSYLVEDLRRASDLVEEVKGDNCPVIETFLINAEELAQRICKNANKIWRLSSALLRDIRENKKDLVSSAEANAASVPSHDPSERCNVKTSAEKKYLIKLGPHQPKFSVFPKHDNIPKRKQCRFSSVWYTAFPHLEYSISKDAAFCYVCSLFPSGPGREQADNARSTDGVRQWHKMTSRDVYLVIILGHIINTFDIKEIDSLIYRPINRVFDGLTSRIINCLDIEHYSNY